MKYLNKVAFGLINLFLTLTLSGQSAENLDQQLKAMDSILFELGFNQCRLDEMAKFIADDLEFYHDQGGVSHSKEEFMNAIRTNICANEKYKPIRNLQETSVKVFPLFNQGQLYGAIQQGDHEFYIREPNKDLYLTSTARFVHLWLWQQDHWVLKRVLSFDHQVPKN